MAVQTYVGTLVHPAWGGANATDVSQSITGVGFEPKFILFWTSTATADGTPLGEFYSCCLGFTDGTGSASGAAAAYDNVTTTVTGFAHSTTACIVSVDPGVNLGSADYGTIADLTSMDSDGFTLNWTWSRVNWVDVLWNFLCVGGSNIETAVIQNTIRSTTGSHAVTGVGFQPDFIIALPGYGVAGSSSVGGGAGGAAFDTMSRPALGWGVTSSKQGCFSMTDKDNVADTITGRYQRYESCLTRLPLNDYASVLQEASLTSMDSDGFTLNVTTASTTATNREWHFLCVKGVGADAGYFTQPTSSTGSQTINSLTLTPKALMLFSVNSAAIASPVGEASLSIGGADNNGNQASMFTGDVDAIGVSRCARYLTTDYILPSYSVAATANSSTLLARAEFTQFVSSGFELNWTTIDGTAREILYLALGDPFGTTVTRMFPFMGLSGFMATGSSPTIGGFIE